MYMPLRRRFFQYSQSLNFIIFSKKISFNFRDNFEQNACEEPSQLEQFLNGSWRMKSTLTYQVRVFPLFTLGGEILTL